MHNPHPSPLPGQQPLDMHQTRVIPRDQHLRTRLPNMTGLIGAHRHRHIRILHRERPTKPAALLSLRKRNHRDPPHRTQQPLRTITHPQQPGRVTRRMHRDLMREIRPHINHTQHIHQKLTQLIHPRRQRLHPSNQPPITTTLSNHRMLMTHRGRTRTRRSHHRVIPSKRIHKSTHRRHRLRHIPRIHMHLTTTRLSLREINLNPQPPQQRHRRHTRTRKHRVIQTRHKQPNLHQGTIQPRTGVVIR